MRRHVPVLVVVAAAGASSRMGQDKALLPYFETGQTFLSRITTEALHAGAHVLITHGGRIEPPMVRALSLLANADVSVTENAYPHEQLAGSVRSALERMTCDVLLVWPVDTPFADANVVRALVHAAQRAPCAVPVHGVRPGHPVAFAPVTFEALLARAAHRGPRDVIQALAPIDAVWPVPVDDERICIDIDTPEAYRRYFGRDP